MRSWVFFLATLLAWPAALHAAPTEEALRLARSAEAAGQAGDYVAAISLFKAAWSVDPRVEYRCNVGVAYYRAKDLPRAHLFLTECLTKATALPPTFVTQVRDVLSLVEVRLATGGYAPVDLAISPPGAAVRISAFALDEPVPRGGRIWLPMGTHVVVVQAPGYTSQQRTLALMTTDPMPLTVDLLPLVSAVARKAAVPSVVPMPTGGPSVTYTPGPPKPVVTPRAPADVLTAFDHAHIGVEATEGLGAPLGLVGVTALLAPHRVLSVELGMGIGLSGVQKAAMVRLIPMSGRLGPSFGIGLSSGPYHELNIGFEPERRWDNARWFNTEVSFHGRWASLMVRGFVGYSRQLSPDTSCYLHDPGSFESVDGAPCDAPGGVGLFYVGGGVRLGLPLGG